MGLEPEEVLDSCFARAMSALHGVELRDPGTGYEWRLMPLVDDTTRASTVDGVAEPKPQTVPDWNPSDSETMVRFAGKQITMEFAHVLRKVTPSQKYVLPEAGICSLDQIAGMTDEELLAIDRVGPRMVSTLREAIRQRNPGLATVREAFGVLVHGLDEIDPDDPMREPLAQALQPLTSALADSVA